MSRDAKWYVNWIRLLPASTPDEKMRNIEAADMLEQMEAAQPKWISVNDMLPEKDGKYIVCTAKGSVYCTRFKAYGKSGSFQTDINTHITHWMSLPSMPEPPKEDA